MSDPALTPTYRRQGLFQRIWTCRANYFYILPTIGLLLLFMYYPAISALLHAFFKWDQFGNEFWIGLANFRQLYGELFTKAPGLPDAVFGMVQQVAFAGVGLLVAFFLLTEAIRERSWSIPRTLAAAPIVIAGVIAVTGLILIGSFDQYRLHGGAAARLAVLLSVTNGTIVLALVAAAMTSRRRWWMLIVQFAASLGAVSGAMLALNHAKSFNLAPHVMECVGGLNSLGPWLLGAALVLSATTRLGSWTLLRFNAVAVWLGALVIIFWSLATGLADIGALASAGTEDEVGLRGEFLLGHGLMLLVATGQMLGWLFQGKGKNPWWRRLYTFSTVGAIFFGLGLLVNLTLGDELRSSCWNLARIMTFQLTVGLFVPLLIAEVLFHLQHEGSKYIYRVLFVIPMVVPGIVHLLMWQFIYNYDWGVLNRLVLAMKTPQVQGFFLTLLLCLWIYLTHMSTLGRRRAGLSTTVPRVWTLALLGVAAANVGYFAWLLSSGRLPDVAAAWGSIAGAGGVLAALGMTLVGLFESLCRMTIWNFRAHPNLQALVSIGVLAWIGWKAYRWRESAREMGAKPAGPYVVFGLVGLVIVLLLGGWMFQAYQPEGAALGEFVSDQTGMETVAQADIGPRDWLGDSKIALYSIMMMGFPWVGTISMLIFYAGLQAIPDSVLESARLDGSTGLRRFFHIDFPLILGQFKLLLILGIIGGIQNFQQVLLLTYGGPGNSTEMPGLLMYKEAFEFARLGYGTTIGVMMFLVILLVTYVNMKYIRPSAEEN